MKWKLFSQDSNDEFLRGYKTEPLNVDNKDSEIENSFEKEYEETRREEEDRPQK